MKALLLLTTLSIPLTSVLPAVGQDEDAPHPIDAFYDRCIEQNDSTNGQIQCTAKAAKKWDAELNRVYTALLEKLPEEKAAKLKKAQRDWIAYRDSSFKSIDAIYEEMDGTMYLPMHAYARLKVVRERVLELTGYLRLLEEAAP